MQERDVREEVSKAYTRALEKSQQSCCAPSCCAPPSAAENANYADEKDRFADAAASSFGCGNPLAFAGVEPGQTVLDLGSGAGFDLLIAAEKVGPTGKVIGVDMTDAMIAAAEANVAKAGFSDRVELRKGHIEQLPLEDGSVDWVISNCVINLSPEKTRVFREIHRVLKPGGRFSISDIVVDGLPEWIRDQMQAYVACVAGAISENEYLAGLESAGLVDLEVSDRLVYNGSQICGLVESDLENFGVERMPLGSMLSDLEGKIQSIRISGKRP